MDTNTNHKHKSRKAKARLARTRAKSRQVGSKAGRLHSVKHGHGDWESTQTATNVQPSKVIDQGSGNDSTPAVPNDNDFCPISKSIEAVLNSKSEARQQRALQQQQTASYQVETRRPIVCLAFVVPLLLFYEIGSIQLGHQSLRSGIDQWFHQPLHQLGLGSIVVLPLVTIAVLLSWHHQKNDHWKIRPQFLVGMLAEAVGLGLILFWAANAIYQLVEGAPVTAAIDTLSRTAWWSSIVACVGSGIYEELIFRIGGLTILTIWVGKFFPHKNSATVIGVISVSLLFAALHYSFFNPAGNPFELSSFVFRTFASVIFCVLFLFRGFGIAVGAHVAYDVLTQV